MATEILRPDALGDEASFDAVPGLGEENWEDVDEAVADDDTTKVTTGSGNEKDLYNISAPTIENWWIINKITLHARCQRNGVTEFNGDYGISSDGVESWANPPSFGSDWDDYSKDYTTDPATGEAWLKAAITALQIGVKTTAGYAGMQCTQIYVVVDYTEGDPPDPPTDVQATDGAHIDKVVITWTKSDGATGYQPYRDGVGLGWLGDVDTYDDDAADPPTITPGAANATDGEHADKVALSISGQSSDNGTSHTYKVVARSAFGESGDSGTDTGYTGTAALTYQWQRSLIDSDANYTSITGAVASTHNDVDAPANGRGRFYRCVLNATGAAQQISAVNRGYRLAPTIPLLGATRIDSLDYLAQLGDETVLDYSASEKAANTIIGELIALQNNTPAVTAGTIEYTTALSIDVPQDSILGVLMRMQEMLGGYMYVDNNRALQWLEDIGEDTGQQIRYKKNLKSIHRTIDYSEFANRIYPYGSGEGEERIKLAGQLVQSDLAAVTDIAEKRYKAEAWQFTLSPSEWMVGYYGASEYKIGGAGRFTGALPPQGKTITEAYLKFSSSWGNKDSVHSIIEGEDADAPVAFSTLANYDARVRTTASVSWNAIAHGGGELTSPDIKTVIQEIVDRGSYDASAIVIFWDDHDANSDNNNYTVRAAPWDSATLYIRYADAESGEYLEDTLSQEQYGGIYTRTLINKAISDSETLEEWGILELLKRKDPYISYEIDMLNLDAEGLDFEALQLGSIVKVIDEDLDIDVQARVVKITRDLSNPLNTKVEIANKVKDVIDQLGRDFRWRNENY